MSSQPGSSFRLHNIIGFFILLLFEIQFSLSCEIPSKISHSTATKIVFQRKVRLWIEYTWIDQNSPNAADNFDGKNTHYIHAVCNTWQNPFLEKERIAKKNKPKHNLIFVHLQRYGWFVVFDHIKWSVKYLIRFEFEMKMPKMWTIRTFSDLKWTKYAFEMIIRRQTENIIKMCWWPKYISRWILLHLNFHPSIRIYIIYVARLWLLFMLLLFSISRMVRVRESAFGIILHCIALASFDFALFINFLSFHKHVINVQIFVCWKI